MLRKIINKYMPQRQLYTKTISKNKNKNSLLINTTLALSFSVMAISQVHALNIYDTNFEDKYSGYILQSETEIGAITLRFIEGTGMSLEKGKLRYNIQRSMPSDITESDIKTSIEVIESLLKIENLMMSSTFKNCMETSQPPSKSTERIMNLFDSIYLPSGSKFKDYEKLLANLNQMKIIEIAYSEPIVQPPSIKSDLNKGTTLNLQSHQGYLEAAPNGINALFAWDLNNGAGEGVKIIDIEQGWNLPHEDLSEVFYNSGHFRDITPFHPNDYWNQAIYGHGTAVLGIMGALKNEFGITGISHNAEFGIQSEFDDEGQLSRVDALCEAIQNINAGDILLLEQQTNGPIGEWLPVEYEPGMFTAISYATQDKGIIVVEAAANGLNSSIGQDLDSSNYEDSDGNNVFDRDFRDSGAIMVGASKSSSRTRMEFSNFGSRIDVNAWGENVTTLGRSMRGQPGVHTYFYLSGEDRNQEYWYRSDFSGTSSASPIVTGAAAIIQSISTSVGNPKLNSIEMRTLLASTGTPQASGDTGNIGSQPNLEAAIATIVPTFPVLEIAESVCNNNYCIRLLGDNFSETAAVIVSVNSDPQPNGEPFLDIVSGNDIYSRTPYNGYDKLQFPIQNLSIQNYFNNPGLCFEVISDGLTSNKKCFDRPPTAPQGPFMGKTVQGYKPGVEDKEHTSYVVVGSTGNKLKIWGNSWKKIDYNYNVTPNTVLKFKFRSNQQVPEISGIGFIMSGSTTASSSRSWQVHGTQNWGRQEYHNYSGTDWIEYTIPVGESFTGFISDMVFIGDEDIHVGQNIVFKDPVLMETVPKQVVKGFSYDPIKSGHGMFISQSGLDYHLYFTTHDQSGHPEWFIGQSTFVNNKLIGSFTRVDYDFSTQSTSTSVVGSFNLDYSTISVDGNANCNNLNRDLNLGVFNWTINGQSGAWCLQPLYKTSSGTPSTPSNYSGLWYEPALSGWGIGKQTHPISGGLQSYLAVFYYDSNGYPRWSAGLDTLSTNSNFNYTMSNVNGYPRNSTGTATLQDNGSLFLNFGITNTANLNVTYPYSPGGIWNRSNANISQLTN